MPGLKQNINCPRRMVIYAIFDVLDQMHASYDQSLQGDIQARVRVLSHLSEYAFAVTAQSSNTSVLHISMLQAATGMTEEDKGLALQYLAGSVLWHIDNAGSA